MGTSARKQLRAAAGQGECRALLGRGWPLGQRGELAPKAAGNNKNHTVSFREPY